MRRQENTIEILEYMRFLSDAANFLRRLIKGTDYLDAPCVEQCSGPDCVDLGLKPEPKSESEHVDMDFTSGECNGHAYVDMGLSVKWATCNVGASTPVDYGDYFAWGETEPKSSYYPDNCETWQREIGDIGGTSRDVAHAEWGGGWRMPTKAEFWELLDEDNCTWEWTTLDGHRGYKVKSKKTGNSIFLPAAGWRHGTSLDYTGAVCLYWSSTPSEISTWRAIRLDLNSSLLCTSGCYRTYGQTVRPVVD